MPGSATGLVHLSCSDCLDIPTAILVSIYNHMSYLSMFPQPITLTNSLHVLFFKLFTTCFRETVSPVQHLKLKHSVLSPLSFKF